MLFGIGGFEFFLILLFGFLIFGPDKLPAIAKTVAQALNKFKSAQEEMSRVIKTEVYDPTSDEPFKNPLEALAKVGGEKKAKAEEKTESFSERKARYDKERAAKLAAEEKKQAAATAAPAAPAATAAASAAKAVTDASKENAPKDAALKGGASKESKEEAPKDAVPSKPKPSADELYGNKPTAKMATSTPKGTAKMAASTPKPAAKDEASTPAIEEKGV